MRRLVSVSRALVIACMGMAASACASPHEREELRVDGFPHLVAESDARIGDVDDPDIGFSRLGSVDVDDAGNVYALEAAVPEIRVYGTDGSLLRRIGRRGEGPGEFQGSPRFGVVGDTVWTWDFSLNRITLFDRNGTVLSTGRTEGIRIPLPSGSGYVLPWEMRSDGKFTGHFSRVSRSRQDAPTGVEPTDTIPWPFVLFDASGAVTDTIGWAGRPPPRAWRPPSEDDPEYRMIQVAGQRRMVPSPPSRMPWWITLDDGYLLIDTPLPTSPDDASFTVTRIGLEGDTLYHRAIHYDPLPYTDADLDSIAAWAARNDGRGMVPIFQGEGPPRDWERVAASLRTEMVFPEFQLPITSSPWLAQDGSLWLRQTGEPGATVHWLVLDAEGRPEAQLDLPSDLRILWNRGDTFWAADPDEYDVPWLVRFRMHPPSSP